MKFSISSIGEKILLAGFFFTPFTSLRFGIVGIGEVFIVVAALLAVFSGGFVVKIDVRLKSFVVLWLSFIFISLVGFYYNYFFVDVSSGSPGSVVFDLSSYLFIFLSVLTTGHYSRVRPDFSVDFFRTLFFWWGLAYLVLYGLSFFVSSVFGLPLRYYRFFSPLVDNVHQAASLTCAMAFVMFFMAKDVPFSFAKVFYVVCSVSFGMMALDSGSTKAMLGVVCGALVGVLVFLGYRSSGRSRHTLNAISLFVFVVSPIVMLFQFSDYVAFLAIEFFTESDGGGAREALYAGGFEHGLESFLVGYGPGSHTPYEDGYSDAHNTTLTVFLQSGILGVFVFLWFVVRLVRDLSVDFALIAAMTAVGMYMIGGDVLRRLPIWLILMGLVYLARSRSTGYSKKSLGREYGKTAL